MMQFMTVQVGRQLHMMGRMEAKKVRVGPTGDFVIPVEFRTALGVDAGGELFVRLVDGQLHVTTAISAVRRAQRLFRTHVPAGTLVVDDFLRARGELS